MCCSISVWCVYIMCVFVYTAHFLSSLPPFIPFLSQIHSCRDSLRLPPQSVLEHAERKLIEWGKSDEALEKVAEMLGKVVHPSAAVVPQEEIPPPPSAPIPHLPKDLAARVSPSTPVGSSAGTPTHHNPKDWLSLIEVRDKVNRRGYWYDYWCAYGTYVRGYQMA